MIIKTMHTNIYKIFIILSGILLLCACSTPVRVIDPTIIQELRGYIKPDKNVYHPGETVTVTYWLANVSEEPIQEQVLDGSPNIHLAFQGYNFNAIAEDSKTKHLSLQKDGEPYHGSLVLKPNEEKLFAQNVFLAEQEGSYILSFEIRWRDEKKIAFKPVTIKVLLEQEASQRPVIDPEVQQALLQLSSEDYASRVQARQILKSLGEKSIPHIILLLNHKNIKLREEATFLLLEMKQNAVPALLAVANHNDPEIRMRTILILSQIGDQRAMPIMIQALLKDPNKEIRLSVLKIISEQITDELAVPLMIKALDDPLSEVRAEVFASLKKRTRHTIDFDPEAKSEARQKSIEMWKQWWVQTHPNAFQ